MKQFYQLLKSIFRNRQIPKKVFVPFLLLFFVSFTEVSFGWDFANSRIQQVSLDVSNNRIKFVLPVYHDGSGSNDDNLIAMTAYLKVGTGSPFPIAKISNSSSAPGSSGQGYFNGDIDGQSEDHFSYGYYNGYSGSISFVKPNTSVYNAEVIAYLPEEDRYAQNYTLIIYVKFEDPDPDFNSYSGGNASPYNANLTGWGTPSVSSWSASQDLCNKVEITVNKGSGVYTQYRTSDPQGSWSTATNYYKHTANFSNSASSPVNTKSYDIRAGYGMNMKQPTILFNKEGKIPKILSKPAGLTATQDNCDSTITLNWDWSEQSPVGGFNVEKEISPNNWISLYVADGSDREYTIPHSQVLLPNLLYKFRVSARNKCNIQGLTKEVEGKWIDLPFAPTNFEAKDTTFGNERAIFISWEDNAINESRYVLKKTLFGGSTSEYINLEENQTSYIDDNAAICNKYVYEVFAQNKCTGLDEGSGIPIANDIEKVLTFDLNTTFNPDDNTTASSTERFIGSKGYYPNRVEIKWSTANNLNLIEYFKIYRRQLGFNEAYTQIASVTSSSQLYIDETTNAGTLYEYLIIGEAQCLTETVFTDSLKGIGFRSPSAIVNGQVNYTGGIAVENVKVLFETTTQSGKSVKLDGSSYLQVKNDFKNPSNNQEFYLENWIYPIDDSVFNIFEHDDFTLAYNSDHFEWQSYGDTTTISDSILQIDQWQHVGLALRNGLVYLIVNGEGISYLPFSTELNLSSIDSIKVGEGLEGNIEELRFWNSIAIDTIHTIDTVITINTTIIPNVSDTVYEDIIKIVSSGIKRDFSRYLNGNETGLITYLRLDEYAGGYAYDLSYTGLVYNRNNAEFIGNVIREDEIPTSSQLSYAAYTNNLGSYTATIPFTGVGQNFTVTPSFKTHQFDPPTTALFLGDGSSVNNGVDFEDISSFPVTGSLFYENSTCAVEDAFLLIDGKNVIANGKPVQTDANGDFQVQVPIGNHIIEVQKSGHIFNAGRFPSVGAYNFQEPVNGIEFEDSTKIKVIGRVVGGLRDIAKIPGLGRSKNNIGRAQLIFKSQQGNGCSLDTAYTNSETGEYEIFLPPLKYVPVVSVATNPLIKTGLGVLDVLDFDTYQQFTTIVDTVFNEADSSIFTVYESDYHFLQDYVYRVDPMLTVMNTDGVTEFSGDKTYTYVSPISNQDTTLDLTINKLLWPVFTLGKGYKEYKGMIKVFEEYTNFDGSSNVKDSVPTTDGSVKVISGFSKGGARVAELSNVNTSDTIKSLIFEMPVTGVPNFMENTGVSEHSYTNTLEIIVEMNSGLSIPWKVKDSHGVEGVFRGYLLGSKAIGQQFVTNGPEAVDFILRDPPGSDSFSERESGSSHSSNDSWNYNASNSGESSLTVSLGTKFTAGIGVQIETEVTNELSVGVKSAVTLGRSGSISTVTTSTKSWSTDAGTDQTGAGSDLFLGKSKNIEFGITKNLVLVADDHCSDIDCYNQGQNGIKIGEKRSIKVVPKGYDTQFIYSQNHIKNYLIPKLKEKRNAMLQSDSRYSSYLPIGHENYGKSNDDTVFASSTLTTPHNREANNLDNDGDSYKYTPTNLTDSLKDEVWSDNQQIYLWEKTLYDNEWEKWVVDKPLVLDSLRLAALKKLEDDNALLIFLYSELTELEIAAVETTHISSMSGSSGAVIGSIGFAVTTASGIATAELANAYNKYLHDRSQIEDSFDRSKSNYSISGGSSFSSSESNERSVSNTTELNYNMSVDLALEIKAQVNGTGPEDKLQTSFGFEKGRSFERTTTTTDVTNFTIADGDQGDYFSVDVYPSVLGNGPIFKLKAGGQTSCPFEDAVYSEYFKVEGEPVLISAKTLQRDKPTISIAPSIVQNVPLDEAAVFNLNLGNASESDDARYYNYQLVTNSNPFGAIVKIDGLEPNGEVSLQGNSSILKTVTIEKGPGPTYKYDSLLFLISTPCQYEGATSDNQDLGDSVYFSAHFIPGCSDVSLATPSNQWVLNNSFNDTMQVSVVDYNINFFDLNRFRIDYKPSNQADWIGLESYYKDTTDMNDPDLHLIPTNTPFTFYDWDVKQLVDGEYDLRVITECDLANESSETYSGVIDRVNPHAFGSPSPADGILDANDDISMKFNENIAAGGLTSKNFDIRGVLNGSPLRHQASVEFDGSLSYVEIPTGLNLQSRDFTIEFWAQNKDLGQSVFLSQGAGSAEGLKIGTESSGKVFVEIGGEKVTTTGSTPLPSDWHHYAFAYNYSNETLEIFIDGALKNTTIKLYTDYIGSGKMNIGKSTFGDDDYFEGNIHDLRIWNHTRSLPEVVANLAVQVGKQNLGLLHNWKMDEATGESIEDHIRFRNGILHNTEWDLNPGGNAITFDSSLEQNYRLSSANVSFVDETDFTIEFWFNGSGSAKQTLFSNGKGDGVGADSLTSWNITKYTDGSIHILHNGQDIKAIDSSSFDENWHHFAMSVDRTSVLTTYLDGNSTSTTPVSNFREFGSDQIVIGSRYYINGITRSYDEYLNGSIDEFRIWNLNRSQKQIQRDMRYKLQGDEIGLISYLPFETYVQDLGVYIMSDTYEDLADTSHHVTNIENTLSLNSPKIKLPRPIEKVDFDYSVNGDKVVLTPTTPGFRFENVTLDITVKDVQDLHGNSMQSPKTWIAYPDRNQVVWETESVSFEIMKDEDLTFTKKVVNSGGSVKNFTLENIPNWLTTDVTEGVINPGSTFDIVFTKVEGVNIGSYKEDIVVMTDFGYPERLTVSLKVNGEEPVWDVNPQAFDKSMSIIGGIAINDVTSIDDEDILYAFVDGECRGKANLQYISSTDKYVAFLDVYSNTIYPDTIDFKIYDASTGSIFVEITPDDITFSTDGLIGSLLTPETFSAYSKVQENHPLQVGWNWISFHLETIDTANLANLLSSVDFTTGDQIKTLGNNTFASYDENLGWVGKLQQDGVNLSKGYKLKVANADTLSNIGDVVDPTTIPIEINEGWNWIGFVSIRPMNINVALGNLEPQSGDLIKGRAQFSVYDEQLGWIGSLNTLYPNQSYMYKSSNSNDVSFTFPFAGGFKFAQPKPYSEIYDGRWPVEYSKHISNMSAIVEVEECFGIADLSQWYVGFFDGTGTCRSLSTIDLVEDKLLAFVTAVGSDDLNLSPRLLNKTTGQELKIHGGLKFKQNTHTGSYETPIGVQLTDEQCKLISVVPEDEIEDEYIVNQTLVYPSVFSSELNINYFSQEDGKITIELVNSLGQIVRQSKKSIVSGNQTIKFSPRLSRLANGGYLIRINSGATQDVFKLIKKD